MSVDIVDRAQHIADTVLFPAALDTDRSCAVPVQILDVLANAGLYGLAGPASAGGLGADSQTVYAVQEALASGCLSTAFVWTQHIGVVRAVANSQNPAVKTWLGPLCRGEMRAGVALAGALAGTPGLRATPAGDGWLFSGSAPFVSGWERVDVLHAAAATEDGRLVWALVDAGEGDGLTAHRLDLIALNATNTVRTVFDNYSISHGRVTRIDPDYGGPTPPEIVRSHASLALGVARRCCLLLGPTPLDDELRVVRDELDRPDATKIEEARGAVGELAMRAAQALAVTTGSRSLLIQNDVQRLVREALFVLLYALRPGSRADVLSRLGAT